MGSTFLASFLVHSFQDHSLLYIMIHKPNNDADYLTDDVSQEELHQMHYSMHKVS